MKIPRLNQIELAPGNRAYRLRRNVTAAALIRLNISNPATIKKLRRARFGATELRIGFLGVFPRGVPTITTVSPTLDVGHWCLPFHYLARA